MPGGLRQHRCALYGVLAARKGVDLLAAAVRADPAIGPVVIAGPVSAGYAEEMHGLLADMRASGADVELVDRRITEGDALELLGATRCVVLPYPRHYGMSRVLLEAAAVGTPVVVHDHGMVADLVRRHRLGLVVDCRDAAAFARAVKAVSRDIDHYQPQLAAFSARYGRQAFTTAVTAPFTEEC
jgi:glycosyltransferase involved in cell wall biosynthesis